MLDATLPANHPKKELANKKTKFKCKILNVKKLDILKIDIEGAEHELFKNNYDTWLPNTRCLIIELHDRMRNRSSQNFFKAISKYDFSYSHQGENLVFINNNKL